MTRVLNARERNALDKLSFDHDDFVVKGHLPRGIGIKTLENLLRLGLISKGPSKRYHGQTGWRITPDGWRCMYGQTYEEIMAPGGEPALPLSVWRWPLP